MRYIYITIQWHPFFQVQFALHGWLIFSGSIYLYLYGVFCDDRNPSQIWDGLRSSQNPTSQIYIIFSPQLKIGRRLRSSMEQFCIWNLFVLTKFGFSSVGSNSFFSTIYMQGSACLVFHICCYIYNCLHGLQASQIVDCVHAFIHRKYL